MTGSHWRDMFEQPSRNGGRAGAGVPPAPARAEPDEDGPALDPTSYTPWILQRVRSRPTMLLHLRRYEPRSGLWQGWALSYPSLLAAEYVGERMLSLDFGARQFVIEGEGLSGLIGPLQAGIVTAMQEYSSLIWPARPSGALVHSIRRAGIEEQHVGAAF